MSGGAGPAPRRFALGIQYDGRDWRGWQSQAGVATLQDALEEALGRFTDAPTRVTAAGRTDTGVHALGQVVHFDSCAVRRPDGWVRGVNSLLPASLAVRFAAAMPDDFHARFSAVSRTYHYVLYVDPVRSPSLLGRVGWSFRPLDVARMRLAAGHFVGEHDFSALRSAECQAKSPVRHVQRIDLAVVGRFMVVTVQANAFLHHMVRNLVACLVAVGNGSQSPQWAHAVLLGRDRSAAAPTFAPDGLYLASIEYPQRFAVPAGVPLADVFPGLS